MKTTAAFLLSLNLFNYTYSDLFQTYEVTAYTAGYESTGKHPDHPLYKVTASGATVEENHTIACAMSIDFDTQVYIPYFGRTFTCEDRGGAIKEGHLDVYMDLVEDALEFGRRHLKALVFGPYIKYFAPV